ncbi:MAG: hydrogenase [Planctomycetota bacterium]|nr:MAG: hydrogenase [Planctomycetota bacterium]
MENEREYKEKLDHTILESLKSPSPLYWLALALSSLAFLGGLVIPLTLQSLIGIGLAHINNPVGWGVYITNFVFWVGIAHSGTLISAVLFLFRAKFRSSFNRSAEAMTVFAVLTAGLFPLIHLGRIWLFYWLFPYPNQRQLWVNFRSPLIWDVFAVNTYLTVSCIFFYVGLIPDLAMLREKTTGVRKWFYGILSLGWKGSKKQWVHYAQIYLFLAAFATPLVVSVHSVVSWDFAMGIVPGWHATIFAPYFVAGAIFSGCAMVLTLVIPMRKIYRLEKYITMDHFNSLVKLLIVTSLVVGYSYFIEFATAFYNGQTFEVAIFKYRPTGDYAVKFWLMVICNCLIPLTLFIRKLRFNLTYLFIVSIFINIGMWLERFNIIVTSLSHEFDPYGWGLYSPSIVEILITIGSFGFFFTLFLIFTKVLPVIAVTEVKEVALSHHDH